MRLKFPTDIPDTDGLYHPEMTPDQYIDWLDKHNRALKESGQYQKLRQDPNCRPNPEPFVLKH